MYRMYVHRSLPKFHANRSQAKQQKANEHQINPGGKPTKQHQQIHRQLNVGPHSLQTCQPVFRIWIRIQSSQWIRIRNLDPDPRGQQLDTKIEKSEEISCFEVLDVLFCGQKASPVAWMFFIEA